MTTEKLVRAFGSATVRVSSDAGFPAGAALSTRSTLYFGFGFEAIPTALERTTVMGRAMAFLGARS